MRGRRNFVAVFPGALIVTLSSNSLCLHPRVVLICCLCAPSEMAYRSRVAKMSVASHPRSLHINITLRFDLGDLTGEFAVGMCCYGLSHDHAFCPLPKISSSSVPAVSDNTIPRAYLPHEAKRVVCTCEIPTCMKALRMRSASQGTTARGCCSRSDPTRFALR